MISFIMLRIFIYSCWICAFSLMHLMAMEPENLPKTNTKIPLNEEKSTFYMGTAEKNQPEIFFNPEEIFHTALTKKPIFFMEEENCHKISFPTGKNLTKSRKTEIFNDYACGDLNLYEAKVEMVKFEMEKPSPAYRAVNNDPCRYEYLDYRKRFWFNYGKPNQDIEEDYKHEVLLQEAFVKYWEFRNTIVPAVYALRESKKYLSEFLKNQQEEIQEEIEEKIRTEAFEKMNIKEKKECLKSASKFFQNEVLNEKDKYNLNEKVKYNKKKNLKDLAFVYYSLHHKPFDKITKKLAMRYFLGRKDDGDYIGININQRNKIIEEKKSKREKYKEYMVLKKAKYKTKKFEYNSEELHPTSDEIVMRIARAVDSKSIGPFEVVAGGSYASEVFLNDTMALRYLRYSEDKKKNFTEECYYDAAMKETNRLLMFCCNNELISLRQLYLRYLKKYPLLTQLYENEKGPGVYSLKDPNYSEVSSTVIVHAIHRARGKSLNEILDTGSPEEKAIALKAAGKTLANANLAGVTFVDCSPSNVFVTTAKPVIVSWIDTSELALGYPRDENFYLAGIIRNLRDILSYCSSRYPFSVDQVKERSSYFMIMFSEYMNVYKTVYPKETTNKAGATLPDVTRIIHKRINDLFDVLINKNMDNDVLGLTLWKNDIMSGVLEEIAAQRFHYDQTKLNCAFKTITEYPAWN